MSEEVKDDSLWHLAFPVIDEDNHKFFYVKEVGDMTNEEFLAFVYFTYPLGVDELRDDMIETRASRLTILSLIMAFHNQTLFTSKQK